MAKEIQIKVNVNSDSGKKALKDLNTELNNNLKVIEELEEQQKLYNEALKQVKKGSAEYKQLQDKLEGVGKSLKDMGGTKLSFLDELSELPGVAGMAGQSIQGLKGGLNALARHPIVAIVLLLVTALMKAFQAFKSTQEGTELLNQGMAALQAVIQPVMDALVDLVTFLVENLVAALKFVAEAIEDVLVMFGLLEKTPDGMESRVEKAMRLQGEYDKLIEKQKQLAVEEAKAVTQIEELKRIRDDETKGIEARIAANEEVAKIQNKIFQEEIKNQQLIVKNMQERFAMGKITIEETEALREAEIKLQEFKQKGIAIEVEQATNRVGLIKEELDLLRTRNDNAIALAEAQGKTEDVLFEKKRASLTSQIGLLRQRNATELAEYKDLLQQLKVLDAERVKAIGEREEAASNAIKQIRIAAINDDVKRETDKLNEELRLFKESFTQRGELTQQEQDLIVAKTEETQKKIADIEKRREEEKKFAVANTALIEAEITRIKTEELQKQELADLDVRYKASIEEAKGFKSRKALTEQYEKDRKAIILGNQANINAGLKAAELELINLEEQKLLSTAQTEEEKTRIIAEQTKKRLEIEQKYTQDVVAEGEKRAESWQEGLSDFLGKWGAAIQFALQSITQALDIAAQLQAQKREERQFQIEQSFTVEEERLKASLANREMTEAEYNAKVETMQRVKEQKERIEKQKAFNQDKKMNIAKAVISTAQAVLSAFASAMAIPVVGPALAPVFMGIAAALGAAQIAVISKQQFRAARGGVVPGQGPSNIDSVPALLAPGETVINAQSSKMFSSQLSDINQAGGGVSLAPSMESTNTINRSEPIYRDNEKQSTVKAYVVESEQRRVQDRVSRYETGASFG